MSFEIMCIGSDAESDTGIADIGKKPTVKRTAEIQIINLQRFNAIFGGGDDFPQPLRRNLRVIPLGNDPCFLVAETGNERMANDVNIAIQLQCHHNPGEFRFQVIGKSRHDSRGKMHRTGHVIQIEKRASGLSAAVDTAVEKIGFDTAEETGRIQIQTFILCFQFQQ